MEVPLIPPILRYDWRILANGFAATFSRWRDRALLAATLPTVMAILHVSAIGVSARHLALAGGLAGLATGLAMARTVAARLDFHTHETPFAGDALLRSTRLRYGLAWHLAGLLILLLATATATATARWSMIPIVIAGYTIGGAIGGTAAHGLAILPWPLPMRARWRWKPRVGEAAIAALLATLLLAGFKGLWPGAILPATALVTAVAILLLAPVDDAVVRFMALAGRGAMASIHAHLRPALAYLLVQAPLAWWLHGMAAAALALIVGAALLLMVIARVLAYRILPKRPADLMLVVLTALAAAVGAAGVWLLPLLALIVLAALVRRASGATWIMP